MTPVFYPLVSSIIYTEYISLGAHRGHTEAKSTSRTHSQSTMTNRDSFAHTSDKPQLVVDTTNTTNLESGSETANNTLKDDELMNGAFCLSPESVESFGLSAEPVQPIQTLFPHIITFSKPLCTRAEQARVSERIHHTVEIREYSEEEEMRAQQDRRNVIAWITCLDRDRGEEEMDQEGGGEDEASKE